MAGEKTATRESSKTNKTVRKQICISLAVFFLLGLTIWLYSRYEEKKLEPSVIEKIQLAPYVTIEKNIAGGDKIEAVQDGHAIAGFLSGLLTTPTEEPENTDDWKYRIVFCFAPPSQEAQGYEAQVTESIIVLIGINSISVDHVAYSISKSVSYEAVLDYFEQKYEFYKQKTVTFSE